METSHGNGRSTEDPGRKPATERDQWAVLGGIRFLLAMIVVLHHVGSDMRRSDPTHTLDFGAIAAVIGFFVISGYSMANSLTRDSDTRRFYARRFWRIYPSYVVALALAVAPALLFTTVLSAVRPGWNHAPNMHQLLMASVFMQSFLMPGNVPSNGVLWSLSIEVWLYVLCPWLFMTSRRWLLILATCSAIFYVVYVCLRGPQLDACTHGIGLLAMAWAFIGGFVFYRFRAVIAHRIPWLAAGVVLGSVLPNHWSGAVVAVVVAVVLCGDEITVPPAWRKPLIFAGDVSYPLYLVHMPVLHTAVGLGHPYGPSIVCAAIVVAIAVRVIIEVPVEMIQKRYHLLRRA